MIGIAVGSPITDDNGTPEDSSDDTTYSGAAYPYRGNVYGGGCGTDKYVDTSDEDKEKHNPKAGIVGGNATTIIDGGYVVRNVYGAGAMGSVTGKSSVNISGNSTIGDEINGGGYVYTAARGSEDMGDGCATVGRTELKISGGTIWGSAFGGGQLGAVKGSVAVVVSGGVIKNDVYGGGASANTNTNNWDATKEVYTYDEVSYLKVGTSVVTGLYTRSGEGTNESPYVYTEVESADAKAANGVKYYRQIKGGWAEGKSSSSDTTSVILIGGVMGNAYGGGLGDVNTPVYVFGDVTVNVNMLIVFSSILVVSEQPLRDILRQKKLLWEAKNILQFLLLAVSSDVIISMVHQEEMLR
jgi:hypothetical protein